MSDKEKTIFRTLSEIDISSMVRQKGQFWYMPWSNAVREVTKNYPDFNWEFTKFEGLPFLKTEIGYFVECSVTILGQTKTQMMPVLDYKNQTNMSPTAEDINKSQMRALAKAISLHGLGLDLWAGEDLIGFESMEELHDDKIEKIMQLYNDDETGLTLWGYVNSFRGDTELFKWIYNNFPKGYKTKVAEKINKGRSVFFDYKAIFTGEDDYAIEEAKSELSEIELKIINKYLDTSFSDLD